MKESFILNRRDRYTEYVLLFLVVAAIGMIIVGLVTQGDTIDRTSILFISFLSCLLLYLFLFAIHCLSFGTLTEKWTPNYIYLLMLFISGLVHKETSHKHFVAGKLIGTLSLIIAVLILRIMISIFMSL